MGENVTTLLWGSVRVKSTLPKLGLGSPLGLPKLQSSIVGVKILALGCSLYHWKAIEGRCRKWPLMSHLDIYNTSYGKKKGRKSNWQFDSRPLKVGNRPNPSACRRSAIHHWKALKDSYKFAYDLISIGGLSKKLWPRKIPKVQIEIVSGLLLGSPEMKSHSNVGATKRHRVYYMGESGAFPRVWAVVSHVSLELPVACPSTKGAPESELTNLLVGLMQVQVSKWSLSLFLVPSRSFSTPLYPF
jgi:hypothetical protein